MTKNHGMNKKILHINLESGERHIETPPEDFYQKYIGGKSLGVYYLLHYLKPGVDPLSPENVMVFSTGPLAGVSLPGQGRSSVVSKSPLTSGLGSSEAGGYWGPELKRAGFDAIVVTGRAPQPVYIWIHNDQVEIRPALHLWGKTTGETTSLIQQELLVKNPRMALIGQGGERLIRFANIAMDLTHFAGRGGLGAVMGSKNLKGIVVKGDSRKLEVVNRQVLKEISIWLSKNPQLWEGLRQNGTGGSINFAAYMGALPTRNFSEPTFPQAEEISGEKMSDTILIDRDTCDSCLVHCKRVVEITEPPYLVNRTYGGPEYETLGAFGSSCGVNDLRAVAKANEICNAYGLDSISAGLTIAFAMECAEKGLLKTLEIDRELRFGDAQSMLEILQAIIDRRGIGDLLAEGSARAAQSIPGSEAYSMNIKGEELPMHEPRLRFGHGFGMAVSPNGPDHMTSIYDDGYIKDDLRDIEQLRIFTEVSPLPIDDLSGGKIKLLFLHSNWQHFLDCVMLCHFLPYDPKQVTDLVNAITGWRTDPNENLRAGERFITLARVFNLREGLTDQEDTLPDRFFQSFKTGPIKGKAPSREEFRKAKTVYYELNGWTGDKGIPTTQRLKDLGLEWAAEELVAS